MTCIRNNELKNISECNLLHDIINAPKRTKQLPLLSYSTSIYEY